MRRSRGNPATLVCQPAARALSSPELPTSSGCSDARLARRRLMGGSIDSATSTIITDVLLQARSGDREAIDRLFDSVYDQLRRIAHHALRYERTDHTLGTTGLVHEAYFKLVDQNRVEWHDRAHFFGVASRAMRQILVEYARRRGAVKRGGRVQVVALEEGQVPAEERAGALLAVDEALTRLAAHDSGLAQVVECRFFAGLTEEETAEATGASLRTVQRKWRHAKAWLYQELTA
jgi:RNA polymerase sigma factor (TIGR02999 family)